jgi:propionyl-CoA carboxylase alpha chain
VYAEDPMNDFLPSVGPFGVYQLPVGKGIRVDNGFRQGMDIPLLRSMLAKLIALVKLVKSNSNYDQGY